MMMFQFLLDTDADVTVPAIAAPQSQFGDVIEPISRSRAELAAIENFIAREHPAGEGPDPMAPTAARAA
jgi:ferritin